MQNASERPQSASNDQGKALPTIKPGMHVRTSSGLVLKVQKASKHGVLTLVNTCGGFAMFSHAAVVQVVQA